MTANKESPLERYMSILETVAPFSEGLTAVELEAALDLPKTTVNRLLHALLDGGMISLDSSRGRTYRLGDRMLRLLHSSPDTGWVEKIAQRPLQTLAERTGLSAFISKFDGTTIKSITCVAPDTPIRMYVVPGMAMPPNATATGKAILAFQGQEAAERILAHQQDSFTGNTITDPMRLREELLQIRKRGFATDLAEHVAGLGSIAYPIFTPPADVIYAVGVTGAYGRVIDENFKGNCAALADAAGRLGKLLQLHQTSEQSS
jgi:DNA-binding IclR family transcriptional regulator